MSTVPKINRRYLRTSEVLSSDGRASCKWRSPECWQGGWLDGVINALQEKCPRLGMWGQDPGGGPCPGALVNVRGQEAAPN